ncbi:MAG: hypothetical protein VB913_11335 [Rhodospirillales bacterium]
MISNKGNVPVKLKLSVLVFTALFSLSLLSISAEKALADTEKPAIKKPVKTSDKTAEPDLPGT